MLKAKNDNRENEVNTFMTFSAEEELSDNCQYVDTGAREYICGNKHLFKSFENKQFSSKIAVGDGMILYVIGHGTVELYTWNGLKFNLFSAGFVLDKGLHLVPNSEQCNFVNDKGEVRHQLLCHQNIQHVKSLLNRKSINLIEDITHFGKQHRLPFHVSVSRATKRLELVHTNVCGPMKSPSVGGAKMTTQDIEKFISIKQQGLSASRCYCPATRVEACRDDTERCAGKEKEDSVQEMEEDVNERTGIQDRNCDGDLRWNAITERENEGIEGEGYLRLRRNIKKPSFLEDYHLGLCNMVDDDPKIFDEAVSNVYSNKWMEAMARELIALKENCTWGWVTKPSECTVIDCKWVFFRCNHVLWLDLKCVLCYVKGTLKLSMVFTKNENCKDSVVGFVDSDWAGDRSDRKSTGGFIFKVFGCIVSWVSWKQSTFTLSSTESEFVALSMATSEACWLKNLYEIL
ncbi:hypothetical protein PR048_008546, partial [Dryococelus australis]